MKHTLSAFSLAAAFLSLTSTAIAQGTASNPSNALVATPSTAVTAPAEQPTAMPAPSEELATEPDYVPLQVGDATQSLLDWQSSGEIASKTPRPIAGPVAWRNYERYLKSFEFPIPDSFGSSVKSPTTAAAK